VLVWFVSRAWPGTDNVFDQDSEGTARAPSFLFWHHAERKGGKDGEATVSGAVPTLVLHCSESLRTDSVVRVVRVGPAALSECAPEHFGFADGSTFGFPAYGCAVLAVGIRRVVMVQAAQVTRFLERAAAMLQKLLES
jgi:hypothetical protein